MKSPTPLVSFYPNDYCYDCDTYGSMECMCSGGGRLPLKDIEEDIKLLDTVTISGIICTSCNKVSEVDWSRDMKPKALIQELVRNNFLQFM